MSHDQQLPEDPLNLESIDRQIRINELAERAKDLGVSSMGFSEDCPPQTQEDFLSSIEVFETAPISTQFEQLTKDGCELPPPDSLDDAALHAKLWEIANALAERDVYLERTDHLSDRELYEHLWHESLREEVRMLPRGSGWINHIDILGGCSEEDIQISLRYYDDEETRQHWAKDFPEDVIPPHEHPPFDRDRHLPQPPPPPLYECDDNCDESGDDDFQ